MLKLLRTLPKVLKYLPSDKAKDARNFMMSFQVPTTFVGINNTRYDIEARVIFWLASRSHVDLEVFFLRTNLAKFAVGVPRSHCTTKVMSLRTTSWRAQDECVSNMATPSRFTSRSLSLTRQPHDWPIFILFPLTRSSPFSDDTPVFAYPCVAT